MHGCGWCDILWFVSGNVRTGIEGTSRDHLVDQLLPVTSWSDEYYVPVTPNRWAPPPNRWAPPPNRWAPVSLYKPLQHGSMVILLTEPLPMLRFLFCCSTTRMDVLRMFSKVDCNITVSDGASSMMDTLTGGVVFERELSSPDAAMGYKLASNCGDFQVNLSLPRCSTCWNYTAGCCIHVDYSHQNS